MKRLAVIAAAMALIAAVPIAVSAANPDIGGDAVHTEEDYFSAGEWGLTVYSYVYDSTSTSVPDLFQGISGLDPGEMLFVYLADCDPSKTASVEHYTIGNPELQQIYAVGYSIRVEPVGYNVANHQKPYIYGYSDHAQATIFTYFGDIADPWCTLDPGEYSLVYYFALSNDYGPVSATADSQGIGDTQFVPGPLCVVEFYHFARFAEHWLDTDCNDLNNWCGGADRDYNGDVNSVDLGLFVDEWLNPCPDNWPLF